MNEQPPESITNALEMRFNKIPAGTFTMGSSQTEKDRRDDEFQHKVSISKAFYMQTTEVTQEQWRDVMGTEPWIGERDVKKGPNYPASYVSWDDAVAFCKKLRRKEAKEYRLPTEAEREYACRAGTTTSWSFGDDERVLGDFAWYKGNTIDIGEQYAHQVSLKQPNSFGLYDMLGNVGEWCYDYHGVDYYKQSPEQDPQGPASGRFRILRGGAYFGSACFLRSANRGRLSVETRHSFIGFRLVLELD